MKSTFSACRVLELDSFVILAEGIPEFFLFSMRVVYATRAVNQHKFMSTFCGAKGRTNWQENGGPIMCWVTRKYGFSNWSENSPPLPKSH